MTEDASPENLRKFLESDDPAMVRMGLSMAKGSGVTGEMLGEILWMYMFHDDKTIRAAAKSTFMKLAPEDAKQAVKENWKAEYRENPTEHDRALSSLIRGLKKTPVKVVKPLFSMFGPLPWRAESETTQLAAIRALGKLGTKNDEVCDFLLLKFGESKKEIKGKIIISLGLTGNRKAIPVLKPLLKDKSPSFRKIVAEAMNNLNYKPEETADKLDLYIAVRDWDSCVSLGEPAFDRLLKLLEGRGNKDIKSELCTTIGKFNDKRAITILIKYTSSRDSSLLNSAALALGSMRAVEAVGILINDITMNHIPRAGNDSINATSRVEALGMIGDSKALTTINRLREIVDSGMSDYSYGFNSFNLWQTHLGLLESCNTSLSEIIEAQVEIGEPVVEPLIQVFRDIGRDPNVQSKLRAAAKKALRKLGHEVK